MKFEIGDRVTIGPAALAEWARGATGTIEGFIKRYDGKAYMATVRIDGGGEWTAYLSNLIPASHASGE